ncbi:phosphatase PAP2 family protein [Nocardioides sediminis]|uniref:phosphatase PAP2 family protein n=1 Tax=Nocardioides sediminis TaxID=433648 RepID=UPI000D2FC0C0|nr:phosphatase PAP2 family protein [Nocardioides sediminis]
MTSSRRSWSTTVVALVGFALLTVLVVVGATRGFDVAVRDLMRPQDQWGERQVAADVVVEGLRPEVLLMVLLVVGATSSARSRSWYPFAYVVLLSGGAALPALAVKVTVARTDPHDQMSSIGSFPSGHVLFVLVVLGGIAAVGVADRLWWVRLLVGGTTALMGVALLLQAAHWATDVIGGVLLGTAVLGAAYHSPLRPPGHRCTSTAASAGSTHTAGPAGSGERARRPEA